MEPFEPDELTLELLGSEHQNGTWIGTELLPIANRIRNDGGSESDFLMWVKSSHLWTTYVGSTNDSVSGQRRSLYGVWPKAGESKPFDLEEALTALRERIAAYTAWPGRTGSRDRAVAIALVDFCIEHNCFTRTLSSYELAKWTAAISQKSVSRALLALIDQGLIREVQRTDRRASNRTAKRYRVNLWWAASSRPGATTRGVANSDSMNTGKHSLSQELTPPTDLWSRKGLGPGAQRVYEALTDDPVTARSISDRTGINVRGVKRFLGILAHHCLAGSKPGAPGEPVLYFRIDTPLDAVADALGIYGHVEIKRWELGQRQNLNRSAYPGSYRK